MPPTVGPGRDGFGLRIEFLRKPDFPLGQIKSDSRRSVQLVLWQELGNHRIRCLTPLTAIRKLQPGQIRTEPCTIADLFKGEIGHFATWRQRAFLMQNRRQELCAEAMGQVWNIRHFYDLDAC